MGRHKKEQTYTRSIRFSKELKDFLDSLDNTNIFVTQLLEDTNEFKQFIQNQKNNSDNSSLFNEIFEEDTHLKVPFSDKDEFVEIANIHCRKRQWNGDLKVWIVQKGTLKKPFEKWLIL